MRLDVHVLRTKQRFCSLDRQVLNLIDDLLPFVIARAWVTFRILVGDQ